MGLSVRLPFYERHNRGLERIFAGSLFPLSICVREYGRIRIDVSSECTTERTIFDILTGIGFDLQMCGTKYIMSIMVQCVNSMSIPEKTSDFYTFACEKFNIQHKAVEMGVQRALETVKAASIFEVNRIFDSPVFHRDAEISPGMFLSNVCARLVMLKSHDLGKTYFG
jgi:hypothetical protein